MSKVVIVKGDDPYTMIRQGFDVLGIKDIREKKIVIKPNLITNKPFPITTPLETVDAIIGYINKISKDDKNIIVAEGGGWGETYDILKELGYLNLLEKYKNVELVDLNTDSFELAENQKSYVLKK